MIQYKPCPVELADEPAPQGFHRHECPECGTVWEHSDNNHGDPEAHTCPNCGCGSWWKAHGVSCDLVAVE